MFNHLYYIYSNLYILEKLNWQINSDYLNVKSKFGSKTGKYQITLKISPANFTPIFHLEISPRKFQELTFKLRRAKERKMTKREDTPVPSPEGSQSNGDGEGNVTPAEVSLNTVSSSPDSSRHQSIEHVADAIQRLSDDDSQSYSNHSSPPQVETQQHQQIESIMQSLVTCTDKYLRPDPIKYEPI